MNEKDEKYPEGHFINIWMGIGIAIFSGLGIPLSILTENPGLIGIGPAFGVAFGIAIGQKLEKKYKEEGKIRPANSIESKKKKDALTIGMILLILGLLLVLLLILL